MNNSKFKPIRARLESFIDLNDAEQCKWLEEYARDVKGKRGGELHKIATASNPFLVGHVSYCKALIDNWSARDPTSEDAKLIKNLRSAWRSQSQESKNKTFSLSYEARKSLKRLSTATKTNQTQLINALLRNAEEIQKLSDWKKLLQSEAHFREIYQTKASNVLCKLIDINSVTQELNVANLDLLREKELNDELLATNEQLLTETTSSQKQNNELKQELLDKRHLVNKLKTRLGELQIELATQKAFIDNLEGESSEITTIKQVPKNQVDELSNTGHQPQLFPEGRSNTKQTDIKNNGIRASTEMTKTLPELTCFNKAINSLATISIKSEDKPIIAKKIHTQIDNGMSEDLEIAKAVKKIFNNIPVLAALKVVRAYKKDLAHQKFSPP